MDLPIISDVDRKTARAKVAEYLKAVRERHHAEDEEILRGYRALARGHAVLSLPQAIANGGFDAHARPHLAIAPATAERVLLDVDGPGYTRDRWTVTYSTQRYPTSRAGRGRKLGAVIHVAVPKPPGYLPNEPKGWWSWDQESLVPHVPPSLRPARGLGGYHVLWEAEWRQRNPPPPRDPALVKHLGGDLWAVMATWDLSDIELAVLAGRAWRA